MAAPRKIDMIVVHHTITPGTQTVDKTISSINRTHKERLHPKAGKLGHIAYHYLIFPNGRVVTTRPEGEIGYHASNEVVNGRSIGIALVGNYDVDKPSGPLLWALRDKIKDIKSRIYIKDVVGHRKYAAKTCPGKKITDQMILEAFKPKA